MKKIILLLTLLPLALFAQIQVMDGTKPTVATFECGQTDTVRLLLDDSWLVMNHVWAVIKGTGLKTSNQYYTVSSIAIPSDANIEISVTKLNLPIFYGLFFGLMLILSIFTIVFKRKDIDYRTTMIDIPVLVAIMFLSLVTNMFITCTTLLNDGGLPYTGWYMQILLLVVTSVIFYSIQFFIFRFLKRKIVCKTRGSKIIFT